MKVSASLPTKPIRAAFVGEAPGAEEDFAGKPFVGQSGSLLDKLINSLGLSREECLVTNPFSTRPPGNNLQHFFMPVSELKAKLSEAGITGMELAAVLAGERDNPFTSRRLPRHPQLGYLKKEYEHEIDRLHRELEEQKPPVVIALGGTALFILCHLVGISTHRGVFLKSTTGHKVLATYHPAAVLRDWSMRPILRADIRKAINPPVEVVRSIYVPDTVQEIEDFFKTFPPGAVIAIDTETEQCQITCISFSDRPDRAIVIPIWDPSKSDLCRWSFEDELTVWLLIHKLLKTNDYVKLFQNATYDLTYLFDHGIVVGGRVEDTMLMHHVLQPEMAKSLGFLGSLYCNAPAWKTLRVKTKHANAKKDE